MRRSFTSRLAAATAVVALTLAASGCVREAADVRGSEKDPAPEVTGVVLASTTSTQDSGLFDVLLPAFERDNPSFRVKPIAVGTGEAIALGERKDADVLLVHSKAAEEAFVASGFGEYREDVMYNDFVVVGPKGDPAGIREVESVAEGLKGLRDSYKGFLRHRGPSGAELKAANDLFFASRGDDSGTHKAELKLWTAAGIDPKGQAWYLETGQGMGETLRFADEKGAYVLTDRATWLAQEDSLPNVTLLFEGDEALRNRYGVIPVVGAKNPEGGRAFAEWIVSEAGQKVIGSFGVEEYGRRLFVPDAK